LFLTSIARALDIRTDGHFPMQLGRGDEHAAVRPETIFSYFPADFRIFNGALPAAGSGFGTSAYVTRTMP
jgi:hypothetical protein